MSARSWIAASCALLCAEGAHAQTATLLKDINTTTDASFSSRPGPPVAFNGRIYFTASADSDFFGLWRSDGTASGTERVGKFRPAGNRLVSTNDSLFFAGDSIATGHELYRLNAAGERVLVKDIYPGPANGFSENLYGAGGSVFFGGTNGATGVELWKSDGTEAGTVMVKDINPGGDSTPEFIANIDGVVYFTAEDGFNGRELWRTDGTTAGTALLKDIRPGPEPSDIGEFVRMGDSFIFQADNGVHGAELWRTDGTTAGTTMVVDINPGGASGVAGNTYRFHGQVFNGLLYFAADNGDGSGRGLWVTDGTAAGTMRVMSGIAPDYFHVTDSALFFASNASARRGELWRSDGTAQGTAIVKTFGVQVKRNFATLGNLVYLAADDGGPEGFELWKTDGTGAGTVLEKDIRPGGSSNPTNLNVIDGVLYFSADDGEHGEELWRSDGTAQGTSLVKDIGLVIGESGTRHFARLGAELLFDADDGVHGGELWKTDGTEAGTTLVKDIDPSGPSRPEDLVRAGQFVYFLADDGVQGEALWRTDGTEPGTIALTFSSPGNRLNRFGSLTAVGDVLFFVCQRQTVGLELWKSDGTPEGTGLVQDIAPGVVWSNPEWLVDVNGTLFFVADDGATGRNLWRSNGTPEGTVKISLVQPRHLTNVDGTLFFEGINGDDHALWKRAATGDTVRLAALDAAAEVGFASAANGMLFFFVEYPVSQQAPPQDTELWRSDGTPAGTLAIKTFPSVSPPGVSAETARVGPIVEYGYKAYFMTGTRYTTWDLWETDGTADGTHIVKNLELPPYLPLPSPYAYGGALFFDAVEADADSAKSYLGRTHGTAESTTMYGPALQSPVLRIAGLGNRVFFTGHTSEHGRELWSVPLQPAIGAGGVVDAAGYLPTLAPGGLASLFGAELAGETASASGFPLPTTLAGAKVQVNGIDAPLLFVSPTQINFQVPYGTPFGANVSVVASLNGQNSASQPTAVAEFAPAMFVNPATGEPIVQRHADGSLISARNPARPGETLIVYVTGIGGLDYPPATGAAATDSPLAMATTPPIVFVGGVEAGVLFAGLAPGFAGLGQINIELPLALPQGSPLPLTIRFGASESPTLELPF